MSFNCEKNIFNDILGAFTFGFLENQKSVRVTKNAYFVVNITQSLYKIHVDNNNKKLWY